MRKKEGDMPDVSGYFEPNGLPGAQQLRAEAVDMFTEVQRADAKATTLCGVTGGLLAVDATALSSEAVYGCLPVGFFACVAVLLGVALVVAMSAVRPALPQGGALKAFAFPGMEQRPEDLLSAISLTDEGERLRAEAERLALFASLAHRKFRAVRRAVDITAAAVAVAGIGLLSAYIVD